VRSGRVAAAVGAGLAAGAVVGGLAGRAALRRQRSAPDPEAHEPFGELPAEDLGPVVSFDGTELAVRAAGDPGAPAVVFAHGFSLDMTTWHYQWTALRDRYRVVCYDQRGHGRSAPAAGRDHSLSALGRDLLGVLDRAVPGGPVLVAGHSLGGMALLAATTLEPAAISDRVAGAFLIGTSSRDLMQGVLGMVGDRARGIVRPRLSSLSETAVRADRWRRLLLERGTDLGYLLTRATQFAHDAPPSIVGYVAGLAGRASIEVWTDGLAGLMDLDLAEAAGRFPAPALVAVGDRDRVTPPAAAVALVAALPDARLEVIDGAGHMAMMERHEEVTALLSAFAEEVLPGRRARRRTAGARAGTARGAGRAAGGRG
jgi:pimeloyl-ACP methyl ester carboxylesterase